MIHKSEEQPLLPFPLKPLIINDVLIEEYEIPEDQKEAVLKELYLFDSVPSLEDEFFDLHSGKKFKVRDYRVTRENGQNWLVSPYYEDGGGTVIDWMPPDWADE